MQILRPDLSTQEKCPLLLVSVPAGFPSPAEDYIEMSLDLNRFLVKHPAATFFVRVTGNSMIQAGIHPGDILIVDRSLETVDKRVVIAIVNGEFTVKRIRKIKDCFFLMSENENFKPVCLDNQAKAEIWGVVTHVIHPL